MRNTLALVGAAVVTFGGLGWYLDWFMVRSNPAPPGHRNLNIDIDTIKITEDLHKGGVKVQEVLEKNKLAAETKAKAKAVEAKDGPAKEQPPEEKKPFFDEGGEPEEYPFDSRKPR